LSIEEIVHHRKQIWYHSLCSTTDGWRVWFGLCRTSRQPWWLWDWSGSGSPPVTSKISARGNFGVVPGNRHHVPCMAFWMIWRMFPCWN